MTYGKSSIARLAMMAAIASIAAPVETVIADDPLRPDRLPDPQRDADRIAAAKGKRAKKAAKRARMLGRKQP